ncbi:MAG: YceI family protein [Candidatus Cyclonatronum sp.]|uniref:YceI family protein n=1 Tax=Cyclonatronum sp. TaxID=3024185 RepID=UPI0025C35461|nr:YceI family protein [Cyclonatronum sp.]MCH8487923.1 YceI family protein [Cyclonatronum sp.]
MRKSAAYGSSMVPALLLLFLLMWPGTGSTAGEESGRNSAGDENIRFFAHTGYVEFVSRAPLLEFTGSSEQLNGLIDFGTQTLDFFVDLETLDTRNRRRDRDMRRNYLETHRYPFAEFTGRFTEPVPAVLKEQTPVTVEGRFTMREIPRDIRVEGFLTPEADGIRVTASWEIRLEDFNIDRPRIVFYELSEVQRVSINILLKPETDADSP